MREFFTISDDGDLNWYLGVNFVKQSNCDIIAKQEAYVDWCLERYGLTDVKPKLVPLLPKFTVTEDELPTNPNPKAFLDWIEGEV
eukprot:1968921-Rhodomonas_salina.1